MFSGSRADIHNVIRRIHGVLVVLHYHQGIAQIPKAFQCCQKLIVVPLVKTDTRLVQNISHAYQPGANLSCQPNPLRLASGKTSGSSCKRQIFQAHINEKADTRPNLLQNLRADQLLLRRQF